jgi:hypothetical protein
MVSSLQRRYLEFAIARQANERGAYEFDAGAAHGANEMLKRIDGVLAEATRTGGGSMAQPDAELKIAQSKFVLRQKLKHWSHDVYASQLTN